MAVPGDEKTAKAVLIAHSKDEPGEFILFREGRTRFVAIAEEGKVTRSEP